MVGAEPNAEAPRARGPRAAALRSTQPPPSGPAHNVCNIVRIVTALVALCVRALPKYGQIDRHGVIAATSARPKMAVPVTAGVSDGGEC
jgi:hypothetical protein